MRVLFKEITMKSTSRLFFLICFFVTLPFHAAASELLRESFDDGQLSARGWYDNAKPIISSREAISGSSLEFRYPKGSLKPVAGNAMRKKFAETETVYLSYYVKYSANWVGSGKRYHPHEFYLLTNKDDAWSGLANTSLTTYIEQVGGVPLVGIQDTRNVDQKRIGQNLTATTEWRGVAGCNGSSDSLGDGNCYKAGSVHRNEKKWQAHHAYFTDAPGPYYKNDWHLVEVYLELNSIQNGGAMADGIVQYWFDGEPVLDYRNVVFRTGKHPDMKFNQLIIGPYIGDGSPVDQTFWIDDLVVASAHPADVPVHYVNTAPVADAGRDQWVGTGSEIVLDGSGSWDADGNPLTYHWVFAQLPMGSNATLPYPGEMQPTFVADIEGDYVLHLIVNDGQENSIAAAVTVTATGTQPLDYERLWGNW
jgi:hypothetical protein